MRRRKAVVATILVSSRRAGREPDRAAGQGRSSCQRRRDESEASFRRHRRQHNAKGRYSSCDSRVKHRHSGASRHRPKSLQRTAREKRGRGGDQRGGRGGAVTLPHESIYLDRHDYHPCPFSFPLSLSMYLSLFFSLRCWSHAMR